VIRAIIERDPAGLTTDPTLANIYFQRFLLAWRDHGHRDQLDAHVVNYADDIQDRT
jgi:RNA-directed DNA polymerase